VVATPTPTTPPPPTEPISTIQCDAFSPFDVDVDNNCGSSDVTTPESQIFIRPGATDVNNDLENFYVQYSDTAPDGSGPISCEGAVAPCSSINSSIDCGDQQGCSWVNVGSCDSSSSCSSYVNQSTCLNAGCSWKQISPWSGTCYNPITCSIYGNETDCQNNGCSWTTVGQCSGTADSCSSFTTSNSCSNQLGCSVNEWVTYQDYATFSPLRSSYYDDIYFNVENGHIYQFRTRAQDSSGLYSDWVYTGQITANASVPEVVLNCSADASDDCSTNDIETSSETLSISTTATDGDNDLNHLEFEYQDSEQGACTGTATSCFSFSGNQTMCNHQTGCSYFAPQQTCYGTPTSCEDAIYEDEPVLCNQHVGCTWDDNAWLPFLSSPYNFSERNSFTRGDIQASSSVD
jgi:hypothetical protein